MRTCPIKAASEIACVQYSLGGKGPGDVLLFLGTAQILRTFYKLFSDPSSTKTGFMANKLLNDVFHHHYSHVVECRGKRSGRGIVPQFRSCIVCDFG